MNNKDKFTASVHVVIRCSVKCIYCLDLKAEKDMELEQFVAKCGLLGWRYVKSAKLRREGPMCPECSVIPDDQLEKE